MTEFLHILYPSPSSHKQCVAYRMGLDLGIAFFPRAGNKSFMAVVVEYEPSAPVKVDIAVTEHPVGSSHYETTVVTRMIDCAGDEESMFGKGVVCTFDSNTSFRSMANASVTNRWAIAMIRGQLKK